MKLGVKVTLDLKRTRSTLKALRHPQGRVLTALNTIGNRYKSFAVRRFDRLSRSGGGGEWPDIKPETKKRKKSTKVLVDTRQMRLGLAADITVLSINGFTIVLGLKQRTRHTRAKMLVAKLVDIHHFGLGRVPERRIIVAPDLATKTGMIAAVAKAIEQEMKG